MNENIFLKIKVAIVATAGAFTAAFGWFGWLVLAWVICMALDWVTGSAAATKNGQWQSAVARAGIWHKAGMIIIVVVAAVGDGVLGLVVNSIPSLSLPFEYSVLICPVIVCWYIFTELGSIAENARDMGAPVPEFLINMLAAAKNTTEGAGNKFTGSPK